MKPFRPWLTFALIAVLGGIYILEHYAGATVQPFLLVRFGASVPVLVWQGQWERIITAGFLHAFREHFLVNAISLLSMGALIERECGRARLLAIYLGASIGGAWTSAYMERGPLSVGASAAIFGLLGAFALMHLKYGDELPYGVRQSRRWWIVILAINGGLSLLVPQIDGLAHAGGFLFGAAVGLAVLPKTPQDPVGRMPRSRRATLVATALVVVTLIGLVRSGQRAFSPHWEADVHAAESAFVAQPDAGVEELNAFAWVIAIDPDAPRRQLELAATAAERAVELSERAPEVLDTLAQSAHRLGHHDRAVALEIEALQRSQQSLLEKQSGLFATQLGRFFAARALAASQPASAPSDPLHGLDAHGGCLQAFVRAEYQGRHAWLVHVFVDGSVPGPVTLPPDIAARVTSDTKLTLEGVTRDCPLEQGTEPVRFTYWPRDPEVDALP